MRQAALTGKRVTARYYRNQYQHWLCFLDSWARPELYADQSRQQRKRTPAQLYASIRCPEMLLFLAAAAGLPEKLLQEAAEASLNAIGAHHNKRTDELRRVISWDVIEAALLAHPKLDLATVHAVEGSPGEPLSFLTDDGDRKTIWDSRTLSAIRNKTPPLAMKDYYRILGVSRHATRREIAVAFKTLALRI